MRVTISVFTLVLITFLSASAQKSSVTKAELVRYAIAADSLKKLTDLYTQASLKISNDPKIKPARQRELALIQGDSLKLVAAKATSYEKAYLKRVKDEKNLETSKFRRAYEGVVNDYVGSDTFSKVKNQLKTDTKLKHSFDSITTTLKRKTP